VRRCGAGGYPGVLGAVAGGDGVVSGAAIESATDAGGAAEAAGVRVLLAEALPGRDAACLGQRETFANWIAFHYAFARPGPMGLTAPAFVRGARRLIARYGLPFAVETLRVPALRSRRPAALAARAEAAREFLRIALDADIPAALLVQSDGADPEDNIDTWHWVAVVGWRRMGDALRLQILDNGRLKDIDFTTWLRTSALGGALLRLRELQP